MGTDENIAHIGGNASSYSSLLKLAESETSKTMEEKSSHEVHAVSERVRFDVRFIN